MPLYRELAKAQQRDKQMRMQPNMCAGKQWTDKPVRAPEHDPVNNPKHYDLFPNEQSIDLIQKCLTPSEFSGFLKGNCLKYRIRAGKKGALQQDIDKADWYQAKLWEFYGDDHDTVD